MASLDDEFARLFEAYMADGGARIIMGSSPPIARVAPNAAAVGRAEWILPYDDVRAIIAQAGSVVLSDCTCRLERAKVGEPCRFPLHVCLDLHAEERPDRAGAISKEEALAVLAESEKAGLVHCVSNVAGGWDWVCNCCGCCCEFLRGINDWQVDRAVVRNYRAVVDAGACTGCGVCEERCQVAAIAVAGEATPRPPRARRRRRRRDALHRVRPVRQRVPGGSGRARAPARGRRHASSGRLGRLGGRTPRRRAPLRRAGRLSRPRRRAGRLSRPRCRPGRLSRPRRRRWRRPLRETDETEEAGRPASQAAPPSCSFTQTVRGPLRPRGPQAARFRSCLSPVTEPTPPAGPCSPGLRCSCATRDRASRTPRCRAGCRRRWPARRRPTGARARR